MSQCSALPAFYLNHTKALASLNLESLATGQSAPLDKALENQTFSLRLLRELAASYTVGTFVVIEHDNCFEVCNLGQGANARLFYTHCKLNDDGTPEEKNELEEICDVIRNKIKTFNNADIEGLLKYDPNVSKELLEHKYVTYAYLQRSCISMAVIRKAGGTKALKSGIDKLCQTGEIIAVSQVACERLFDISGKVYDYSALITK